MEPLSTREMISAFVSRDIALSMGLGLAVSVDGRLTAWKYIIKDEQSNVVR